MDRAGGRRSLHLSLRRPVRLNSNSKRHGLCTHRRTLSEAVPRERPRRGPLRGRYQPARARLGSRRLPPTTRLDPRLQPDGQLRPDQAPVAVAIKVLTPTEGMTPTPTPHCSKTSAARSPVARRDFADARRWTPARCRQQAAEDLHFLIKHFADCADHTKRSSYKAMVTIFGQQCELSDEKVVVKAKTGGDCMQNPWSDRRHLAIGHKGPGYQVQIAETCVPDNEVQLITAALPQSACESDAAAVVPMLDQLKEGERLPEELLADTAYDGDENVQAAAALGVDLDELVLAWPPVADPGAAMTVDDFVDLPHRQSRSSVRRVIGRRRVRTTQRRRRGGLRCRRRPAPSARFGSNARSNVHVMASSLWNSPTRRGGWRGGVWKRRPRCSRSGTRRARESIRPTAGFEHCGSDRAVW